MRRMYMVEFRLGVGYLVGLVIFYSQLMLSKISLLLIVMCRLLILVLPMNSLTSLNIFRFQIHQFFHMMLFPSFMQLLFDKGELVSKSRQRVHLGVKRCFHDCGLISIVVGSVEVEVILHGVRGHLNPQHPGNRISCPGSSTVCRLT